MHLGIQKEAPSPVVPQVSVAHMTVPCAPCITISAASQDTQILLPLAVMQSYIQEQSLQLEKIKFLALWSPFHHILCCRLGLWLYSTSTLTVWVSDHSPGCKMAQDMAKCPGCIPAAFPECPAPPSWRHLLLLFNSKYMRMPLLGGKKTFLRLTKKG